MQRVTPMRRLLITVTSVCMVATALVGANLAQANSVWVQSYERSSETDACDSPPEPLSEWRATWADPYDPISGPTWHPTWEQWANNGNGGWTCTRSVTWARSPSSGSGSSGVTYQLGDIGPGGGIVFYVHPDGGTFTCGPSLNLTCRYLEAWTTELGTMAWSGNTDEVVPAPGSQLTAIGTGYQNTVAAVAQSNVADKAITVADSFVSPNGTSDWYLPSKDELNQMRIERARIPIADGVHWSSSEFDASKAWDQGFNTGEQDFFPKWTNGRVRPVRAF